MSSSGAGPRDDPRDGLALERTRLAWRRTALGLAAGSVAAGRLLQELVGPAAWVVALSGLLAASLVVRSAFRRHAGVEERVPDGRFIATVAVGTAVIGAAALVVLASGRARIF